MSSAKSLKTPPVVEIRWLDSMGHPGWAPHATRVENLDETEFMDHASTGYLTKRSRQYVAVSLSVGRSGQVGDTIQIPRVAIQSMTVLRK